MDQIAKTTRVLTIGNCPFKLGRIVAAGMALAVADEQLSRNQPLAAENTLRKVNARQRIKTFGTDRQTGERNQGCFAKPAIGGEENREKAANNFLEGRDEAWTLLGALDSSFSRYGFTMAEDRPPPSSVPGEENTQVGWLVITYMPSI